MQLPPSLSFDGPVVTAFLKAVRRVYHGSIVCEPRHASWFSPLVTALLERYRNRPSRGRSAAGAGRRHSRRLAGVAYFRLHGSPRTYWSRYDEPAITALAATVGTMAAAEEVWCVFDNTASGAAIENACELREGLNVDFLPD